MSDYATGKEAFLVTITLEEYRELVAQCARYDLLQEQEAQQKAELEAFKALMTGEEAKMYDAEPPVPDTGEKAETVKGKSAGPKRAIKTEIIKKADELVSPPAK